MNTTTLSAALAACALSLSTAACSATTNANAGALHPEVGFAASATDLTGGCALEGMPRVVATHLVPKAGVTATASAGHVWLHFATTHNPDVTLAIEPESLEVEDAGEPPPAVSAQQSGKPVAVDLEDHRRLVAWTEGNAEQGISVKLATVTDDGSSSTALDLGYEGSAIGAPAIAATPEGKGVVAFIESNGAGFHLVVTHVTCGGR